MTWFGKEASDPPLPTPQKRAWSVLTCVALQGKKAERFLWERTVGEGKQ